MTPATDRSRIWPSRPPEPEEEPKPLTVFEAYQRARACWPGKIVAAMEFQGAAGRSCKITSTTGSSPTVDAWLGASFEECFEKAGFRE